METFFNQFTRFYEYLKGIDPLWQFAELVSTPGWWQLILCFLASSLLMINRLNAVEKNGFEGTLVGTLIMPYFSGFPNLCFAYIILKSGESGYIVLENCLVNNITNLLVVLAIPCLFWGLNLFKSGETKNTALKVNHLSLLLSILALIFFSVFTLFVAKDGVIERPDGMLLVGIFLFWQVFHLFDVMKHNTIKEKKIKKKRIVFDLAIVGFCAWGVFSSVDGLLAWVKASEYANLLGSQIGLLSGLLMVLPNAFLAIYYAAVRRSEIAYSSQIGDCHICIPLCIGLFAVFSPIQVEPGFQTTLLIIVGASAIHFFFAALMGKLPRFAGITLAALYAFFFYKEMI